MKIFVGADHRGFALKKDVIDFFRAQGHTLVDMGTHEEGISCDYPKIALEVAEQVVQTINSRGILICMTGIGHTIAANKVPGAYAALCYNKEAAVLSRQHNNSNILVLGSKFVGQDSITEIIDVWLKTEFEAGRHLRRVEQIKSIEKKFLKEQ
ncbi:MAG: ribose 5-phosphate isomerase B [Candidatus Omnitrophica bacterium]|nr:ribose 5-phosphate isomerase B [Candidatus Omnitrophota bacterium]